MSDNHIAVKINGVIYVKLDDVRPMREEIERLRAMIAWMENMDPRLVDDARSALAGEKKE